MKLFCWNRFLLTFLIISQYNCFGLMLYSAKNGYIEHRFEANDINSYQKSISAYPPLRIETKGICTLHYHKEYSNDKNGFIFGPIPIFWSANSNRESVVFLKNEIPLKKLSSRPASCEYGCFCSIKLSVWSKGGCSCSWGCTDSISISEQIESMCSK